jgi:hypothetical protein
MLNTKQVEATLAVEELDNEVAAAIQGGYDLQVYRHANGNDWLGSFDTSLSALSSNANDQISSVHVTKGGWRFYEHANYGGNYWDVTNQGLHNVPSWFNDRISSWWRLFP